VKQALKGEHFNEINDIEHGVTEELTVVSLQTFQRAFEDVYKPSEHCVKLGGGGADDIESLQ
jgi:predicted metal-dependent peptidase